MLVVFFRSARQIFRAERNDAAHTAPASRLHVRRAGAMTILAIELAFLRLADLAHERAAERFSLICVAGRRKLLRRHMSASTGVVGFVPPATGPLRVAGPFGAAEGAPENSVHVKSRAGCRPRPSFGRSAVDAGSSTPIRSAKARTPRTQHPLFGFGRRFLNPGPGCGPVWRHYRSIEHSHVVPKDCHPDQSLRQPLPSQRRRSSQIKEKKRLQLVPSVDDGTQSESDNYEDPSIRPREHRPIRDCTKHLTPPPPLLILV